MSYNHLMPFVKGHAPLPGSGWKAVGRRRKHIDDVITDLEIRLGRQCDPVVTLLELAAGHDEAGARDADRLIEMGVLDPLHNVADRARELAMRMVDRETRLSAARAASKFVRPVLMATQVTASVEHNGSATFPIKEVMHSDEIVHFIENLTVNLAAKHMALLEAGDTAAEVQSES